MAIQAIHQLSNDSNDIGKSDKIALLDYVTASLDGAIEINRISLPTAAALPTDSFETSDDHPSPKMNAPTIASVTCLQHHPVNNLPPSSGSMN